MPISFAANFFSNTAAQTLTFLSQASARPNFEVRFFQAQNKAVERFNKEIEEFQNTEFGKAKTALLRVKAKRLENTLGIAKEFKKFAVTNRQTVKDILDQLGELRALADPGTAAEFDAKRGELLESIEKLKTANVTGLGAPDGLIDLKPESTADLEGIVHNDFATADDIANTQAVIDGLTTQYSDKLEILELNQDIATTLVNSKDRVLAEVRYKIDDIEIAERKAQIDRIQALQDELARTFTAISLSFEGSQNLADFVNQGAVLDREPEPGSVLNLFV
jgi:hypothetical protein